MLNQEAGSVQPVDAGIVPAEPAQGSNFNAAKNDAVPGDPVRAQLARDHAEIEAATAALRKAEPGLESWTRVEDELAVTPKPRPVWLLIGALWVSTALIVAVTIVAIANIAG